MSEAGFITTAAVRSCERSTTSTSELWLSVDSRPPRLIYILPTELDERRIQSISSDLQDVLNRAVITQTNEAGVNGFIFFDGKRHMVEASNVHSAYSGLARQLISQMLKRPQ